MNLNDGEGTFLVTAQEGVAVDGLASYAAGVLAVEFAKACTGGKCSLPPGVVSVTRSGVSMVSNNHTRPDESPARTGMEALHERDYPLTTYKDSRDEENCQLHSAAGHGAAGPPMAAAIVEARFGVERRSASWCGG